MFLRTQSPLIKTHGSLDLEFNGNSSMTGGAAHSVHSAHSAHSVHSKHEMSQENVLADADAQDDVNNSKDSLMQVPPEEDIAT